MRRALARIARVVPGRSRPESTLLVSVPAAESVVGGIRARRDPAMAAGGLAAHVTVLYPFLRPDVVDEEVERAIAGALSSVTPFDFRLTSVAHCPDLVYLTPEPAGPFIRLTEALWRRFPACPPYRGAYDTIVPHLTVTHGDLPAEEEEELERALPIEAKASEVHLLTGGRKGGWSLRRRFPLRP